MAISCNTPYSGKKFTIGFSQCTGGDAWRRQMLVAMQGELAFHPDIELKYKDALNSNERQIRDIDEFVKSNVDLLIVTPNEAEPITPAVERAFNKGIPVIIVDRKTSSSLYSSYIGANNHDIGVLAGSYVAELLKGKGSILEIWGLRGSSPAIDRHRGFMEVITKYPQIKIVSEVDGKWELDSAKIELRKKYKSLPEFDLVFAHNDIMAYGAYNVCKEFDSHHNVQFIGIDGLPGSTGGIQFVDDKILTATFLYPTGGEEAIRIASLILHGQPYEKENILHSTVIDAKNIRVMKLQTDKILNQQKDIVRQQEKINQQIKTYYSQRILIYFLLGSLVIMIVVGSVAILSWREKNEINKRLETKSEEILKQRNTIAAMAEKAELATQEKLKFFTNISHEFKTPLTLILAPIEELTHKMPDGKSLMRENLTLIHKNAIRLLRLVNQLMDFRKIEEKKMMVRAGEMDIVAFIREVMSAFDKSAQRRRIDFQLKAEIESIYVWFDQDMLDKVIFNLLSNAFKFTNDKGKIHISVSFDEGGKNVQIQIEDDGIGMSAEQVAHAFDRFYSGQNSTGTGLGLSLSKEFIELHHGELVLKSEKGKGSRFYIMLPVGKAHFEDYQLQYETTTLTRAFNYDMVQEEAPSSITPPKTPETKEHTLLLIDDNPELRAFLKKRFDSFYNIIEANDGPSALHLAFDTVPDLVICDVMLPGKNGFEVARTLKSDLRTSHIPIVILTAKAAMEQKIEGVQTGADEYITKPFVFEYLQERVKSLIRNREILREHYSHDLNIEPASSGKLDKKFINDFTALVEKNISNPDFSVNDITVEMGISRVQIYRKIKALIGMSVNDYIISVRLKKAQHLLLNTSKSITEISSEVGFASATYFSTTFKAKFNVSPKDFKSMRV
jgi:signal transduction histidine kinase/DNA-binding response OmpR family regulator